MSESLYVTVYGRITLLFSLRLLSSPIKYRFVSVVIPLSFPKFGSCAIRVQQLFHVEKVSRVSPPHVWSPTARGCKQREMTVLKRISRHHHHTHTTTTTGIFFSTLPKDSCCCDSCHTPIYLLLPYNNMFRQLLLVTFLMTMAFHQTQAAEECEGMYA